MELLTDKTEIATFLRQDPLLHCYELGDLAPFFWPHCRFWGYRKAGQLQALALLYEAMTPPTLLAFSESDNGAMLALLGEMRPILPKRFYAHLSPGFEKLFSEDWKCNRGKTHLKMSLEDPDGLQRANAAEISRLEVSDLEALKRLYRFYPGNWFDARMVQTGRYFGVWKKAELLCVAGIHVYSPEYRVAALGNITTHPEYRRLGLASATTACLCLDLLETVDHIVLNVKADNDAAIDCYRGLGFRTKGRFGEFLFVPESDGVGD
jgi:ribosomal protein S18 acetylase RimI-like enzyme